MSGKYLLIIAYFQEHASVSLASWAINASINARSISLVSIVHKTVYATMELHATKEQECAIVFQAGSVTIVQSVNVLMISTVKLAMRLANAKKTIQLCVIHTTESASARRVGQEIFVTDRVHS